jgi:predicted transcriptional regulator
LRVNKRSKVDIYSDILECICNESGKTGAASPTRVAHRANIPYDRFQKVLEEFVESEMVHRTDNGLLITEKGLRCLEHINKANEFLRRMGLSI